MIYSKTGPLEQKLKEWVDQHIILYIQKGQSKVLQKEVSFQKDFLPQERTRYSFQVLSFQQDNSCIVDNSSHCSLTIWGASLQKRTWELGRQQAVHEPECALTAKEAISLLH